MKYIILLNFSFLLLSTSNAQLTKNNWMLGGNIGFSSGTYKSEIGSQNTAYDIQINPNIGYFIVDKFAGGLKTSIRLQGYKGTGTDGYSKYNNYNIGPFVRYYLLPIENTVNLLVEGVYQYGVEGSKGGSTPKNTFSFTTGAVAFFNSSVGIEFLISYSSYKFSGFNGSNGIIQLGLGLQVHLIKN